MIGGRMTEGLKEHLPIIIAVTLVGLGTAAFALSYVHGNVSNMNVSMFNTLIILVPCVVMFICSFIIAFTASEIGRQLYLIVVGICLACGVVSLVVTSFWAADANVAAALLANSGEGETLVPPSNAPIIVLRDIAAYFVIPTIGCIAGAWVGSRVHPVKASKAQQSKKKSKKKDR